METKEGLMPAVIIFLLIAAIISIPNVYAATHQHTPKTPAVTSEPTTNTPSSTDTNTPSGGTPSGGTPSGGTPSGGTPSGGTPSGGTPSGGTPSGGTPSGGTPSGGTPSGGTGETGTSGTGGTQPPPGTPPPPQQPLTIKGPIQQQLCAASGVVALVDCQQVMNIKNIHNTVVRGSNYAIGAPGIGANGASPTVLYITGVGYVELTGIQNAGNGQATITYFVLVPTK